LALALLGGAKRGEEEGAPALLAWSLFLRGERGLRETLWAFERSLLIIIAERRAVLCCAVHMNDSSFSLPLRP
jgi:hypothetical protein